MFLAVSLVIVKIKPDHNIHSFSVESASLIVPGSFQDRQCHLRIWLSSYLLPFPK